MKKRRKVFFEIYIVFVLLLLLTFGEAMLSGDMEFSYDVIIVVLCECLIGPIFIIFILSTPYRIYLKNKKKVLRENLSQNDYSKDIAYYRDILKNYCPATLSYIDDFKLDVKDVIAVLLNLELKKKIKIDEKITIIDYTKDGLNDIELLVFNSINDNGKVKFSFNEFENLVIKDSFNLFLIKNVSTEEVTRNFVKKFVKLILFFILSITLFMILTSIDNTVTIIIGILIFLCGMRSISYGLFNLFSYFYTKTNSYVRTDNGEELNVKLEGLKLFLRDFGSIGNKTHDEIELWEDYMVYSVLFDINTELIKKYSKLVIC